MGQYIQAYPIDQMAGELLSSLNIWGMSSQLIEEKKIQLIELNECI